MSAKRKAQRVILALAPLLFLACGATSTTLAPIVRVDAQLATQIDFVELTVLTKPAECNAVSDEPLFLQNGLEAVATATLAPTASQTFTALARGRYVLIAEAFDASGVRIARGCSETAVGEKREVASATILLRAL